MLPIEVIYASTKSFQKIALSVPARTTIEQAILQSKIQSYFPEIDLGVLRVGIFGTLKSLQDLVEAGDRIEIYRPLSQDPMKSRKQKAIKEKKLKQAARQRARRALYEQLDPLQKI